MTDKPKRGVGRPSKINERIVNEITTLIRAGNYVETAAAAVGISKNTLYLWLRKGAKSGPGTLERKFRDDVLVALATSEVLDLNTVREASKKEWQAAAWRLERRFPDRWRRRDGMTVEMPSEERSETQRVEEALGDYADAFADFGVEPEQ